MLEKIFASASRPQPRTRDLPEEALEYAIAAGDVDIVSRLVQSLGLPTYRQGRVATLQQWYRWLDERGGMARHPAVAAQAALIAADTGRPAEAERWADMVDRWQYQDAARADDPVAEAWAAVARAVLCPRGVKQMSADADEAVQKLAAANIVAPVAALYQGIARILSGDPDDGDVYLKDTVSVAEQVGAYEILALALGKRSLLAMARDDWSQAEALAGQAGAALRRIGMETSSPAPCKPAPPCTGEMSPRCASNWSAPSGCGPC